MLEKFYHRISENIQDNSDKDHWSNMTLNTISTKIVKTQHKLNDAVCKNNYKDIRKYTTTLAAYSYFMYDNANNLEGHRNNTNS